MIQNVKYFADNINVDYCYKRNKGNKIRKSIRNNLWQKTNL